MFALWFDRFKSVTFLSRVAKVTQWQVINWQSELFQNWRRFWWNYFVIRHLERLTTPNQRVYLAHKSERKGAVSKHKNGVQIIPLSYEGGCHISFSNKACFCQRQKERSGKIGSNYFQVLETQPNFCCVVVVMRLFLINDAFFRWNHTQIFSPANKPISFSKACHVRPILPCFERPSIGPIHEALYFDWLRFSFVCCPTEQSQ